MALFDVKVYSKVLRTSVSVFVTLPIPGPDDDIIGMENRFLKEHEKYQTLFLLHGGMADHTYWVRFSNVERYAQEKKLAVVMPSVGNSYYTDIKYAGDYFTYITEELPMILRSIFPLSHKREDNFIAGLSMGGYGAMMAGLRCPDKYAAVASFSGALRGGEISTWRMSPSGKMKDYSPRQKYLFGENYERYNRDIHDISVIIENGAEDIGVFPYFYLSCGTEDGLYNDSIKIRDLMLELGYDVVFKDGSGGHVWEFWDKSIKDIIYNWLPLKNGFVGEI